MDCLDVDKVRVHLGYQERFLRRKVENLQGLSHR